MKKIANNLPASRAVSPGTRKTAFVSVLSGAFVLIAYIHYLAPDIIGGDSADLVGQSYRLGVCHATGYPSTVAVGKLFSLLPVGNFPFRINLMSAVSAAVTVSLTVLITNLLVGDILIAGFSGVLLGLSPVFWSQAEFAEVYAFGSVLTALSLFSFVLFLVNGKRPWFLIGMLVFGVSWTAHMGNLLHVPALAWLIYRKRNELSRRTFLAGVLLFLVGLTPYVWMMWRAAVVPPFCESDPPSTPGRLLPYILGMAHNPTGISSFSFLLKKSIYFTKMYLLSFLIAGIIPAFLGVIETWRKNRTRCIFFILIVLANNAFATNYHFYLDVYAFLMPSFIIVSVWIGIGLKVSGVWSAEKLRLPHRNLLPVPLASLWVLTALLLYPSDYFSLSAAKIAGAAFPNIDLRGAHEGRRFIESVTEELPPDAIVVTPWHQFTLLKYAQTVENARPDVLVLLHGKTDFEQLSQSASDPDTLKRLSSSKLVYYVDARGIFASPSELSFEESNL